MFESESKSHFMTGNTFQTLLRGLLTPAYAIKRKALGLTIKDRGLLLTDAWSGFHCYKTGLNHAREAWCLSSNVKLPALQAGGWSANAQPIDQVHHILRMRLDMSDSSDLGCLPDLRDRDRYQALPVKANGQVQRPKAFNLQLPQRTLAAWQSMPDECFVSAWIACGYFDGSHFPDVSEMTQKDAIESLDPTGLMRQVGIPSDHAGESVSADRWYWCVRMEDGRVAALPSVIGNQVERLVCRHRRDRKMIVDKMPTDWEKKLSTINSQTMSICWNRKTCSMATPWYVKKVTRMVHGKLEFVPGSGKGYELIYLRFTPSDEKDPAGRGTYWLSSANYEARPVCCMNSTADRSGFDLLKEAYAGVER
ncbi:unnamed protein product [Durusdinium trenchii]|uniref:Uncharacterized protein n=1 Tax=Durusdinium trenchii TaxID=1381693 RepID=A0ABP0LUY8_9DINO